MVAGAAGRLWQCLCAAIDTFVHEKRCFSCSTPTQEGGRHPLCLSCRKLLAPRRAGYCPLCGEIAAWPDLPLSVCSACLQRKPPWQRYTHHAVYEQQLRALLLRLKFTQELHIAHHLGSFLAEHDDFSHGIEGALLLPVPLHPQRLRHRGFNQALELARALTCKGAVLAPELVWRSVQTQSQAGLDAKSRQHNLKGAFIASKKLQGARVIVIDDVYTTGATMRELTHTLLDAGVAHVHVAVIARTPSYVAMGSQALEYTELTEKSDV